ncbi:MAG: ferredoxin family protein [Candidatus Bathyarchaeota archaeon]|nr:ferredoxin family protein [Candidatus Bathyarchaeota archaeon]
MPIDNDFKKNLKVSGEHNGHKVWGGESGKLGVHGTNVAVDWDACTGDGVCLSACPVSLYDWAQTSDGQKKSDPVRQDECIQCLACETQCPNQAIKITPPE